MTSLGSVFSHSPSVVAKKTGSEYVLVPLTDNIADMNSVYTLNETGAFIWENIDGGKTVGEIIGAMVGEYEISPEEAGKDVLGFISEIERYLVIKKAP